MKEILAVIQMNKMETTKDALDVIGVPSFTAYKVHGRGKQKGIPVAYPTPSMDCSNPTSPCSDPTEGGNTSIKNGKTATSGEKRMRYLPKRAISIVCEDEFVPAVVAVITRINRTGNFGDGRIFVCPVEESIRIRTGEKGNEAIS